MRKDVNVLPDGSEVRFCYGHRRLEDVRRFSGKRTRCIEALEKIKLSRKRAQEKKINAVQDYAPNRKVARSKELVTVEQSGPSPNRGKVRAEELPPAFTWSKLILPDPDGARATSAGDGVEKNAAGDVLPEWAGLWLTHGVDSELESQQQAQQQHEPTQGTLSEVDDKQYLDILRRHIEQTRAILRPVITKQDRLIGVDEEEKPLPVPMSGRQHYQTEQTFPTSNLRASRFIDSLAASESGGSSKVHAGLSNDLAQAIAGNRELHSEGGSSGCGIGEDVLGSTRSNPASLTPFTAVPQDEGVSILDDLANQWTEIVHWTDTWLTRGSVVFHTFSLGLGKKRGNRDVDIDIAGSAVDRAQRIDGIAKNMAAKGGVFDVITDINDDITHGEQETPVFISEGGLTVRVHRDGTTSPVRELDPDFRARVMNTCYVTCSSPAVRHIDVAVLGVPPRVSFEGRFHDSMLLSVEELVRQPSVVPAQDASSGSRSAEDTRYDVLLRVHLPMLPVGLARVEAVWSDGLCRKMNAGAGFPILFVPDKNIASELNNSLLRLGVSEAATDDCDSNDTTAPSTRSEARTRLKVRGFLQHVGFSLYAGLVRKEQTSVTQLSKLYVVAGEMQLPALRNLIKKTLELMHQALEERDIDAVISEEDTQETELNETLSTRDDGLSDSDVNVDPDVMTKGMGKRHDAGNKQNLERGIKNSLEYTGFVVRKGRGHMAAPGDQLHGIDIRCVVEVFFHFLLTVRPGCTLTSTIFLLKVPEEQHKLIIYMLLTALLDIIIVPLDVFRPMLKRSTGRGRAWRYITKYSMSQRIAHSVVYKKVYKAVTFFAGTVTLMLLSKPIMSFCIGVLIHEADNKFYFALSIAWLCSRFKAFYDYPVPAEKRTHFYMLFFYSFFPCCTYMFYHQLAMKYARVYYPEKPIKESINIIAGQLLWWIAQTAGMMMGNHLGLRREANEKMMNLVEGPSEKEGDIDPNEEQTRRNMKAMMMKRLLQSALSDRKASSSRMHRKVE